MSVPDEVKAMLVGVVGVVEATSYEEMCLWHEYTKERAQSWEDARRGWLLEIGRVQGLPVMLSVKVNTINGHRILFIEATSRMVDHNMVEQWLKDNLPDTAMRPGSEYVNKVDAMNFHNVFPRTA